MYFLRSRTPPHPEDVHVTLMSQDWSGRTLSAAGTRFQGETFRFRAICKIKRVLINMKFSNNNIIIVKN